MLFEIVTYATKKLKNNAVLSLYDIIDVAICDP